MVVDEYDLAEFNEPERVTPEHYKAMWKYSSNAWSINTLECFLTAESFPKYLPNGETVASSLLMKYFIRDGMHYKRPRSMVDFVEDIMSLRQAKGPPRLGIWDIVRMGRK